MKMIIGSARHDENGKYIGGKAGDQDQTKIDDYKGECSLQEFYVHKYGWICAIAKDPMIRLKLAERMRALCNNPNVGYDQGGRAGILKAGIDTKKPTECDCGTGVRQCVKEATGKDPGAFNTEKEKEALEATGLFDFVSYNGQDLPTGTILISKKKGHTAIVVEGTIQSAKEPSVAYYGVYRGKGTSIVSALATVGEKDTSFAHRKKIAAANGITGYQGTIAQNLKMVQLIKAGKLIKA
jgi:hypothetical protein